MTKIKFEPEAFYKLCEERDAWLLAIVVSSELLGDASQADVAAACTEVATAVDGIRAAIPTCTAAWEIPWTEARKEKVLLSGSSSKRRNKITAHSTLYVTKDEAKLVQKPFRIKGEILTAYESSGRYVAHIRSHTGEAMPTGDATPGKHRERMRIEHEKRMADMRDNPTGFAAFDRKIGTH